MSGNSTESSIPDVIYDGGTYSVEAGMSVSGVTITSGTLNVAGSASGTQVIGSSNVYSSQGSDASAKEYVLSGGVETQTTVSDGFVSVASGGSIISASASASALVADGGTIETLQATSNTTVFAINGGTINSG